MNLNSTDNSYKWYAAYTASRAEKKVYTELARKEIECYLPLKKVRRQWSDRIKTIESPLIPSYIFVFVSNREYYEVILTSGVRRYVCFEGSPTPIPEKQIEDLKCFMQFINEETQITTERIRKGDAVKIVSGPLTGICGEVVEIRGKQCILLRFNNLGFCVHAELGANNVELINESSIDESR